ncbi:MAG TPA: hypothetical protein VNU68_19095 [Verrucomicrobiae bacterium]|nr:hypothetical protein [Verrucomicrobiae bacterium]
MIATTKCRKCGETIRIDFGNLTRDQAEKKLDELAHTPMECPGFHVELGGWRILWNFEELLAQAYPPTPPTEPPTNPNP